MNNNSQLKDLLKKIQGILNSGSLRAILESKDLALIGDSLVNFIFSTLKIGLFGMSGNVHVRDNVLKNAMDLSKLREKLGKNTKPGRVADAAESLIVFAYIHNIMTIYDMVEYLSQRINEDDFITTKMENEALSTAFSELLIRIYYLINQSELITKE